MIMLFVRALSDLAVAGISKEYAVVSSRNDSCTQTSRQLRLE